MSASTEPSTSNSIAKRIEQNGSSTTTTTTTTSTTRIDLRPPAKKAKVEDLQQTDPDLIYNPEFMEICFEKSREALQVGEVPIGTVFIKNGEVIFKSRNVVNETRNPTLHAEIVAIQSLEKSLKTKAQTPLKEASLSFFKDVVVYVNCEPCIMCASALQKVGVKAIFFGCSNPRFGGCGTVIDVFEIDKASNPGGRRPFVQKGFRETEAIDLLKEFYKGENPNAPPEKRKPARK